VAAVEAAEEAAVGARLVARAAARVRVPLPRVAAGAAVEDNDPQHQLLSTTYHPGAEERAATGMVAESLSRFQLVRSLLAGPVVVAREIRYLDLVLMVADTQAKLLDQYLGEASRLVTGR